MCVRTVVNVSASATAVAALSVQGRGTQTSFPSADELPAGLLG